MNKKLKIGIDARFFGPKQKGLGRYVQKLVDNLEKTDLNNQYFIFLRKDGFYNYKPKNNNFKKILADYSWYGFKEQFYLPFKIRKYKIDLMHFPHFNVPVFYFKPFVITIHDLILKKYPTRRASTLTPLKYWLKTLAYHIVIFSAIKRSKKVIAVSNYTKNDILKYFKINANKIKVIYEGSPSIKKEIKNFKKNNKSYLLYVGNAYPHKNLENLIIAFNKLIQERKDLYLILVGEKDYFYKKLQNKFYNPQKIIFTDFVSDKDLISLYKKASLYVFPSLYEGFGLPPLEAMSYGIPVLSSQASCLPEILGDAALYFNPENIDDISEKIKYVLDNKNIQEKLISKGFEQIRKYKWNKMAQETLKIYKSVD